MLSLDAIKEAIADVLGLGGEDWSNAVGDAAAEVLFRLSATFPAVVVEGWWRGERRRRAEQEFAGCIEIFCHCPAAMAAERMRERLGTARHAIHRDVLNPTIIDGASALADAVEPLGVGSFLISVDTSTPLDGTGLCESVHRAFNAGPE
jgi:hypothetical protein